MCHKWKTSQGSSRSHFHHYRSLSSRFPPPPGIWPPEPILSLQIAASGAGDQEEVFRTSSSFSSSKKSNLLKISTVDQAHQPKSFPGVVDDNSTNQPAIGPSCSLLSSPAEECTFVVSFRDRHTWWPKGFRNS